jgi:Secretion system C-terminal sorting domain/YHYH protein
LDVHNGRFCVTPEYPSGIYCYFATVDANWNSTYPYAVGPTFFGVKNASKVTSISETVTTYTPTTATSEPISDLKIAIFPNPAGDFIAIQTSGLLREKADITLFDMNGKIMQTTAIEAGSTIGFLDARTLYSGVYLVKISVNGRVISAEKVIVE